MVVIGVAALIIFSVGFLPALLVIVHGGRICAALGLIYGVIGAALALAMAYGLDFAGYRALAGRRLAREPRSVRRGGNCRRAGLLADRRPPRRRVEVTGHGGIT